MVGTVAGIAVRAAVIQMAPNPTVMLMRKARVGKAQATNIDPPDIGFRRNAVLNIKVVTWSLAIWAALMFVSCVVYGLLTPSSMHMTAFLEQLLPGYKPVSWIGFFIGLIESFLYGAFAGLVYVPVYNFLNRNFSAREFR
jgi:2TM family of unknown function (DUF5676)